MAIAMVAMLAFGGTYAYFTAQTKTLNTNKLTIGTVKLVSDGTATIEATGTIVPGAKLISGNIGYTNSATVETLVAVVMSVKIGNDNLTLEEDETVAGKLATYGVTLSTTADWDAPQYNETLGGFVYTLKSYTLEDSTKAAAVQFTNKDVTFDANEHRTETENSESVTAGKDGATLTSSIQGKEITITITAYQSQLFYQADGKTFKEYTTQDAVIADIVTALSTKTAA